MNISFLDQAKILLLSILAAMMPTLHTMPAIATLTSTSNAVTAVNSSTGISSSRNWSGYVAGGGSFSGVSGTWTVPNVSSNNSAGADATWVGIGGVSNSDLIQGGTQSMVGRSGNVSYSAWFETLPQTSRIIPLTINSGDSVTVALTQSSTNQWQISFKNNSTGQSYRMMQNYSSSQSSAEWVEESPTAGRTIVPIDNFGSIQFSQGSAIENGNQVSISGANSQPITMINSRGQALATPSAISSDGSSFTVSRTSASQDPSISNPSRRVVRISYQVQPSVQRFFQTPPSAQGYQVRRFLPQLRRFYSNYR